MAAYGLPTFPQGGTGRGERQDMAYYIKPVDPDSPWLAGKKWIYYRGCDGHQYFLIDRTCDGVVWPPEMTAMIAEQVAEHALESLSA